MAGRFVSMRGRVEHAASKPDKGQMTARRKSARMAVIGFRSDDPSGKILEAPITDEGFDADLILFVLHFHDLSAAMKFGDAIAGRCGHTEGHRVFGTADEFGHVRDEGVQSLS